MQRKQPHLIQKDSKKLERAEDSSDKDNIRIGAYYSKLKTNQKKRFDKIVLSISNKLKINSIKNPLEIILVRQIALNTVRIEEAELAMFNSNDEKYLVAIEKWLFSAQRERREAMSTLMTLTKKEKGKSTTDSFGKLRDILRDEKGLEKSTSEVELPPDGHDRRHYDNVTRVES